MALFSADILDRELKPLIADWLARVQKEPDLTCIPLNSEECTGHLPRFLHDVTARLRLDAETNAAISQAAAHPGDLRRRQGYPVEGAALQGCRYRPDGEGQVIPSARPNSGR
jgi:hypothetical protein